MTIAPKILGQPKTPPEALLETLFRPMGTDGVYGRTGRYEGIVEALAALISRHREPQAEVYRFPPVVSRALIEKSGYLKSFPHLLGCVCSLSGSERIRWPVKAKTAFATAPAIGAVPGSPMPPHLPPPESAK